MLNAVPEPVAPEVPVTVTAWLWFAEMSEVVPEYVWLWSAEALPAVAVMPVPAPPVNAGCPSFWVAADIRGVLPPPAVICGLKACWCPGSLIETE